MHSLKPWPSQPLMAARREGFLLGSRFQAVEVARNKNSQSEHNHGPAMTQAASPNTQPCLPSPAVSHGGYGVE
ncbi:hypothetical protein SUGI_0623090 [Cryptomeria japonica]|nr:hypothetical protein SUGI_0623090 [Cryptomeria japonica]